MDGVAPKSHRVVDHWQYILEHKPTLVLKGEREALYKQAQPSSARQRAGPYDTQRATTESVFIEYASVQVWL